MISFKTFFRAKMARTFTILFAVMLLLANLTVYLASSVQYTRQTERQETSFVIMLEHMIVWENESTLIAFLEHYGHTHGVDLAYADAEGIVRFQTDPAPEGADPIELLSIDGEPLGTVSIGYRQSFYGSELILGLAFVNGVSALLFIIAMLILRRILNRQYGLLYDDMERIGQADASFRFQDMAAINERYTAALKAEAELKTIQAHYVRILAHDVKTPLTVIKVYLEGIKTGRIPFDPQINEELLAQVGEIETMIPQFIEQDLRQVAIRQNIASLITAHLAKLNEVFQTKRMTLDLSIDALELTIASADVIRILEHLVFNAFYYSEPGGVIGVTLDADVKRLTVEDTGIGMSGETIARIHAGTHRGDDAMAYNQKGSGVGFQIVFEIAARIGAAVDIESVLGTGTKVHVWFDRHPR
ncbi:MAG: hypothetical protein A2Y16_02605 [Tenericutes bacterium GWF2_57_13]|nr:MAG: hypothetical protein A2Y16_02605 [Tenericutes bacterium GWF2_57_13]